MEGFWVETNRGLETLNPGFLKEFLINSAPNLKPEIAKELSMACFHILWDKGPRLVPWTLEDLVHEVSATLISLGQIRLARVLSGSNETLPEFLQNSRETDSLEPLTGAISSGFLDMGKLFKGRICRSWVEGTSKEEFPSTGEILLLEAPEPTLGGKASKSWLKWLSSHQSLSGQSLWVVCDWMLGPDQSLFSQVSLSEQKEIAIELYKQVLKHLCKQGGPQAALLIPRKTFQTGNGLPEELPKVPEGIRLGLIPAAQGPGRAIPGLFARGELNLGQLVRSQSPWAATFREWVSIVHRIRRYWAKKGLPGERETLPKTVRWVLKGWTEGPGRPQALSVLREMARLVPAEDEVFLGHEPDIPTEPAEFARWASDPTLLQFLEEAKWKLSPESPPQSGPNSPWAYQGLIWINPILGKG